MLAVNFHAADVWRLPPGARNGPRPSDSPRNSGSLETRGTISYSSRMLELIEQSAEPARSSSTRVDRTGANFTPGAVARLGARDVQFNRVGTTLMRWLLACAIAGAPGFFIWALFGRTAFIVFTRALQL